MSNENFIYKAKYEELKNYEINDTISDIVIGKLKKGIYKPTNVEVAIAIVDKNINSTNNLKILIECFKVIKHENFFQLYNIIDTTNTLYLIFEYGEGENLLDHIINKKRKFNEEDSQIIFLEILKALLYLKNMNIFHRNICLEKIFLTNKNKIKILHSYSYNNFNKKENLLTTPYNNLIYTPPEILKNNKYDPELAEVWSLGILLFGLLCGYLPYSFENMKNESILKKVVDEKIIFPNDISEDVRSLLSLMLKIEPSKRINYEGIKNKILIRSNENSFIKINEISGINSLEYFQPLNLSLIDYIVKKFNIEKKYLIYSIIMNKHNFNTILYYSIKNNLSDKIKNNLIFPYSISIDNEKLEEYLKDNKNRINEKKNIYEYLSKYMSFEDFNQFEKSENVSEDINIEKLILEKRKRETILTKMIGIVNENGETNVQSKLKIFQKSANSNSKNQNEYENKKCYKIINRKSKKSEIIKSVIKKSKLLKYNLLEIDNHINIQLSFNSQINSEEIKTDNSLNLTCENILNWNNEISFEFIKNETKPFQIINFNYSYIKLNFINKNKKKWNTILQITNNFFEFVSDFEKFKNKGEMNYKKLIFKNEDFKNEDFISKSFNFENECKNSDNIVNKTNYLVEKNEKFQRIIFINKKQNKIIFKNINKVYESKNEKRVLIGNKIIFCDITLCFFQDKNKIYETIKDFFLINKRKDYFLNFENESINFRSSLKIDFNIKFIIQEYNIKRLSIFLRYGDKFNFRDIIIKIFRELYNSIY